MILRKYATITVCFLFVTNIISSEAAANEIATGNSTANLTDKNVDLLSRQSNQIRFEDDEPIYPENSQFDSYDEPTITEREPGQPFKFEEDNVGNNYQENSNDQSVTFQEGNRVEDLNDQSVTFQEGNRVEDLNDQSVTFQEGNRVEDHNDQSVTFHNGNRVEDHVVKKRRRRRRRPRYQHGLNGQGYQPNYLAQGQFGAPNPGFPGSGANYYAPGGGVAANPGSSSPPYTSPSYNGYGLAGGLPPYYRRPVKRPNQSFASGALSSVTTALASIAQYDDYQCVPRLLCEAAGGGSLGSSGVLQSIAGLQPLLTVLSAYSGASTSPLFVFGTAVFMGMTNKGNPEYCRSSYPSCPSDPEKLIHYLNNHNGGFFRFFNAPHLQKPQNIQQFYNQLAIPGQNNQLPFAGQYNPIGGHQQNYPTPQINPGFGIQYPNYNPANTGQQQYGLYNPPINQHYQYNQQNYGFYNHRNPYYGMPNPNLYNNNLGYQQNHAPQYPNRFVNYKSNDANETQIQRRIQVKSNYEYVDKLPNFAETVNKLVFSDKNRFDTDEEFGVRGGKSLKFPDDVDIYTQHKADGEKKVKFQFEKKKRDGKSLVFPDSYSDDLVNVYNNYEDGDEDFGMFYQDDQQNFIKDYSRDYNYVGSNNLITYSNINDINDEIQTLYIVRGNGDPNHPEIVTFKPGEKVNL